MSTNHAEGVLLGLACGDALGRPVEFRSAGQIASAHGTLAEMVGHGTWNQPAGTITDDTEQALCIARSLVETGRFDPRDQMERYVRWWRHGRWSSTGRCFDIGNATRDALARFERAEWRATIR